MADMSGLVAVSNAAQASLTLSFDQIVNITDIACAENSEAFPNNVTWIFTPNTGSPKSIAVDGYNGTNAQVDFIGVTNIVITLSGGGNYAFCVDNIVMDAALPVELTGFAATISDAHVLLNWTTATESNNFGFEIERKNSNEQGVSTSTPLSADWETLGFVEGAGNSNSPKSYNFIDEDQLVSGTYFYRLKQIDIDGHYKFSPIVEITLDLPEEFSIKQNYPNPFNPATKIEFTIPKENNVEIKVFNSLGMEVITLLNENKEAGKHSVEFNANKLPSGIYFYKIVSGNYSEIKKMILLK